VLSDWTKDAGFIKKYLAYRGTDDDVSQWPATSGYETVASDRFSEAVRS
jgi:hypothetical protein